MDLEGDVQARAVLMKARFADEDVNDDIKDSWDDPDPAPVPEASVTQKPAKGKGKVKNEAQEPEVEPEILSKEELRKRQEASDFEHTKALFGIAENGEVPSNSEQFDEYRKVLVEKFKSFKQDPNYKDFVTKLFSDICLELDSETVRHLGKNISALGQEMLKAEKDKEKQKQGKKKKVAIKQVVDNDLFGGELEAAAAEDFDDDDFM